METVGILWAGVVVIAAVAVLQNLQGSAEQRDRWREACRQEATDAEERRAARERYEEARATERAAFYAGQHRIKPDGWAERPTTVEHAAHERLHEWESWWRGW